jgi:hypothetical protein
MGPLKALYRSWAIACAGQQIYPPHHHAAWLEKITEDGVRRRAETYYQQLLAESRKYNATKLLRQTPSIGPIHAALLLASRDTSPLPHQAPTLGLRALGVEDESSVGEYRFAEGPIKRSKKLVAVRGLNQNHNHDLQNIFKGAAMQASGISDFHDYKEGLYLLVRAGRLDIKSQCKCIVALAKLRASRFCPSLFLLMRTLFKIAFPFLLWPISVMAQDPRPSGQADSPDQIPTASQTTAPGKNSMVPSDPAPISSPAPVLTPPFLYLQPMKQAPHPAGYAPVLKLSAGYSVTSLGLPSSARITLSGANVSISADSGKHFGATLDLDYALAPNVFSSGRHMDMLSYLVGPVLYPSHGNSLSTFVRVLAGGTRVSGPFPSGNGGLNAGHVQYPTWAAGGGVEYRLSPAFGLRVSVDYLQSHFYNPSGAVRAQNDFRVVNSIVFYPGMPSFRRHH